MCDLSNHLRNHARPNSVAVTAARVFRKDAQTPQWVRRQSGWSGLYGLRSTLVLGLLFLLPQCVTAATTAASVDAPRPGFDQVERAVANYFRSLDDYQQGDLLSKRHVAAAIDAVADVGWTVPDRAEIAQRALADGSFLVRTLSSKSGKKFMRKTGRLPGGYERLDRLSSISGGQTVIRDLIRKPGGDQLVEYMTTTRGGQNLGKMMSQSQRGVDLNKPTGRIYTADDLLGALKQAYQDSAP